ncbi:F-box-like domain protein [Rhizoctonia solani AG-3 Rhs1AP]|uniref:F-box-like domain protein n=1 Tax=Rhizoctonia solani AG-3 Rhs1AP TaxID=1086054 RepID=A0A0A1UI22_9AGAM|nr:F-box-like domain protein [Rhizoctonia solani AG-3 Rhs1AP]
MTSYSFPKRSALTQAYFACSLHLPNFHIIVQVGWHLNHRNAFLLMKLKVKMLEELSSASKQLHVALERYLHICSSIQTLCLQGPTSRSILPEYAQRVDQEVGLLESYDATMQKAKLAIKSTRNYAFRIAPINCLPIEILTRIFYMVRDSDPCHVDCLALVCSRWRSVALGSPAIWSHIDYHPHSSKWFYPELLEQAQLHVARSEEMPLDFHLSVSCESYNTNCYDSPVEQLCRLVAPRMRSLELDLEGFSQGWPNAAANSVMSTLFSECTPGMLSKLVTSDPDCFGFVTTTEEGRPDDSGLKVDIKRADLEQIFSSITMLHLTGLYPRWTSHAYHGLVDLRLFSASTGDEGDSQIAEAQLVRILKASPGLRILHFEFEIIQWSETRTNASRVRLPDLEIVQVGSAYDVQFTRIEHLLRLLEPGPKPLHLAARCHGPESNPEPSTPELKSFFARSNVTKLYVTELPELPVLLPSLPHLKVLILLNLRNLSQPNPPNPSDPLTYPQLDACFVQSCSLTLDDFLALIRHCRPKILTLFDNKFYRRGPREKVEMEIVEQELSAICSDIRIAHTRPNLAEHQDLLEY